MEHLFVVTYGRSGSTVLINLLNAIDGYCIRGENGGVIAQLAKAAQTLSASQKRHNRPGNTGPNRPWHGIDQARTETFAQTLADKFTRSVLAPPSGVRVTGFKEIRHTPNHLNDEEFDATLSFMAERFHGSRFLFNTRDAVEVSKSGWWANSKKHSKGDVLRLIAASNTRFEKWNDKLGDRAFLIDYADYNENPAGFQPLLRWLGEDLNSDAVAEICSERLDHLNPKQIETGGIKSRIKSFLRL